MAICRSGFILVNLRNYGVEFGNNLGNIAVRASTRFMVSIMKWEISQGPKVSPNEISRVFFMTFQIFLMKTWKRKQSQFGVTRCIFDEKCHSKLTIYKWQKLGIIFIKIGKNQEANCDIIQRHSKQSYYLSKKWRFDCLLSYL